MYDYDLTILGGGPGGYVAAIRALQLGLRVAVIEEREMGGTCLNRGCIPTKSLLHAAEILQTVRCCQDFGIRAGDVSFDFSQIMARKDHVVSRLRAGVEALVEKRGGMILRGHGTIIDRQTVRLAGSTAEDIQTGKIIIATGSRPSRPPIPGCDDARILDSDAALSLTECPEQVIIIGGGVIGVEFATLFNGLGKSVTLLEMTDALIPGADADVAAALRRSLEGKGIAVYTGAAVKALQALSDRQFACRFRQHGEDHQISADAVMIATGRKPNTENLGLENLGLKTNRGFIAVDQHMETAIPGIYAIGDVNGQVMLAHAASAQGLVAAANAAGENRLFKASGIPSCVYTDPEVAWVGLSEQSAAAQGFSVKIGRFPVRANGRSLIMGEQEGFAKIITDQKTGEILGAHLMGPRATDLITEMGLAMHLESTIEEVANLTHPHPTISEMLMEAAHDVDGRCLHQL